MEQKNKFIYILPVMFGFFIMGFCDLVGISVTYAKEQFQWTETQAGFLPSMVFLWFFILSVPTAMLMNRIGRKNTVLLSMLFTFAGMVLPFIDFSETSCYVAFALLGIGNTILQVSLNPLLANVVQGKGLTSSLTAGQFVKAISSFVGPLLAGYCSAALGNWALMFPIYAVVTLISSAWLFLTPIQREKVEGETSSFPATLKLLGDNKILLLFFWYFVCRWLGRGNEYIDSEIVTRTSSGDFYRKCRIRYKLVFCCTYDRYFLWCFPVGQII